MEFKNEKELVEHIYSMHLQNTSGRETEDEMFMLGIQAAIDELTELKLLNLHGVSNRRGRFAVVKFYLITGFHFWKMHGNVLYMKRRGKNCNVVVRNCTVNLKRLGAGERTVAPMFYILC